MELAVFKVLHKVVPFLRAYHLYSSQLLPSASLGPYLWPWPYSHDFIPAFSFPLFNSCISHTHSNLCPNPGEGVLWQGSQVDRDRHQWLDSSAPCCQTAQEGGCPVPCWKRYV